VSKLDQYDLPGVPEELIGFKDDVTNIINQGKYSNQVITTTPAWKAQDGESVFYSLGGENRWYFYANDIWNRASFTKSLLSSWITFSGTGAGQILDSFNVSSVTDRGVGDYEIIWDKDFSSPHYAFATLPKNAPSVSGFCFVMDTGGNPTAGSIRVRAIRQLPHAATDPPAIYVVAVGSQV